MCTIHYCSGSASMSCRVWTNWVGEYGSCSSQSFQSTISSTSDYVWYEWVSSVSAPTDATPTYTYNSATSYIWSSWITKREDSFREEERKNRFYDIPSQYEIDEQTERYKEHQKKREEAERVAIELLEVLIGKEQTDVYRETGKLLVHGKDADYLLLRDGIYNIRKLSKGKVIDLCAHIDKQKYPPTDNIISLMLAIQNDERAFEELANNHGASDDYGIAEERMAVAG